MPGKVPGKVEDPPVRKTRKGIHIQYIDAFKVFIYKKIDAGKIQPQDLYRLKRYLLRPLYNRLRQRAKKRGVLALPFLRYIGCNTLRGTAFRIYEEDLIIERVVTPGEDGLPFFRLTKFGQDYISQSAPHYYDPQGYMESLRNIVQNLDPIIEQYIFEGLNCYRRQLFFASAVMFGAAAEKAILLLVQAITDSMSNPSSKKKAAQLLERPNLPEIFDTIRKTLNPLIKAKTIPYSVHQGCTEHLMSLFEMIRVQRNDAVHPVSGQVNRTKVFLSLQTIPAALESIYKLIDWFGNNSIP